MKIINTTPVTTAEVLAVLKERKDGGEELGYEQANALEHAENFAKFDMKKTEGILKKVKAASPKIDEETATKIVDVAPGNESALKAVLLKNKIEISEEEMKEVLKALG